MQQIGETKINWEPWLREIRAIGFTNPLLNFEANAVGQIDLERAHPSGTAQLATTSVSVLSNLFRDPLAFSRSYSAAKRIKARADHLDSQFGVEALALVAGLVNLEHDGFDLSLPILIWRLQLTRKTDDFEVSLSTKPRVNPGLIEAIEIAYGVHLDEQKVLSFLNGDADFVPLAMLEYIASAVGTEAKLETRKILVIGNFATESIELAANIKRKETPLLRQLAGLDLETEPLTDSGILPSAPEEVPLLIADADATQRRVVSRVVAGQSFAVETLPGCGYTQTVVNAIAAAVSAGKSVLVTAPRRQTLNELAERLATLGLPGLGICVDNAWFDVIAAISRNEKSQPVDRSQAVRSLEDASTAVSKYLDLLESKEPHLDLSVSEILTELAKLSLLPKAPQTNARIDKDHLMQHHSRTSAVELLNAAQRLGEFEFAPAEAAWFGARFDDEAQIERAVGLARKLRDESLPAMESAINDLAVKSHFRKSVRIRDLGEQIALLVGIRETLGRFVPEVFSKPLDELIAATGPRNLSSDLSGSSRRRFKKLAKEYVRPGMHVADLHQALIRINEQKESWRSHVLGDHTPEAPAGIADLLVAYQAFSSDLAELQRHLDDGEGSALLTALPIVELNSTLDSLVANTDPLTNLRQRNEIRTALRAAGLTDLARSLATLKSKPEQLSLELELCWWQSALEYLVAKDPRVMQYTAEQIEALEEDFTIADERLVATGAPTLAADLSKAWNSVLDENAAETAQLKALLRSRVSSIPQLRAAAPNVSKELFRVVLASPYEIPRHLDESHRFDMALVVDAAGTTVAENLSALTRVDQVVVFGDEATAAPDGFEIEAHESPLTREDRVKSIFGVVKANFFREVLRKSWRGNGQTLGAMINREFYQNRIEFAPTAREFMGESNLTVEILKSGIGSSTKGTSAVESPDVEVDRVVALILEHAERHQSESLLVSTASRLHADRIESSLSKARKSKPELDEWFDSHGREKFEITPISSLSHRSADRIIFSVGFGVDGSGQPPSIIGDLSQTDGRRYLANLLVSARNRITAVSCVGADLLRATSPLSATYLLAEVLTTTSADETDDSESDPLLEDLALRLKKLGARAVLNFKSTLPLVVSYANKAAVILPDWDLAGETLSERLRLRPALLRAMGWRVIRVHTFELFADPAALAVRIGESLGMQLTKRPQVLFDTAAFDETPQAWGDREASNDARLASDKPPHWG